MTTEEIVNAARAAGFSTSEMMTRIAALKRLIESTAAAEREACAQIAEWEPCITHTPQRIAEAIRARGSQ